MRQRKETKNILILPNPVPFRNFFLVRGTAIAAFMVAVVSLALYALGAQRGMSWQDSGEFQYRVMVGDLAWHSGIARAHPGYIIVASVFARMLGLVSGGAVGLAFGTTLFSAFSMAVALLLLFIVVRRATGSIGAALLAFITLGLAHMARWMATMAEVYAPSLALSMAELLMLDLAVRTPSKRRRFLALLFLVSGIHFSFHDFALLNLPVYVVSAFLLAKRNPSTLQPFNLSTFQLFNIIPFLLGCSPILYLMACEARGGAGVADILRSVLFGEGYMGAVLGLSKASIGRIAASYALAAISVAAPAWLFAAKGMLTAAPDAPSRFMRRALAVLTVIHAVFWCRYFVPDQATFILPLLGYLAVWVGIGASSMSRTALRRIIIVSAAIQMLLPPLALVAARRSDLCQRILSSRRMVPFRDEAAYWLLPWKHDERSAEAFVRAALVEMPGGGTLYADSTTAPPLMMLELKGGEVGLGFNLATPWSRDAIPAPNEAECFVVSVEEPYLPSPWRKGCRFERLGAIHRVLPEDDGSL